MSLPLNTGSVLLVQLIKIHDVAAYFIRASLANHQRLNDKKYEVSGMQFKWKAQLCSLSRIVPALYLQSTQDENAAQEGESMCAKEERK